MWLLHTAQIVLAVALIFTGAHCLGQQTYSPHERRAEEDRISNEILSKRDWRNRMQGTQDDYYDGYRLLYGTLNESVLLRQATGERFGVFEAFGDDGRKSVEIRLHRGDTLTDRFFLYGDACNGASIHAETVAKDFVVYQLGCFEEQNGRLVDEAHQQYLFDYASRNFYRLAFLDYDPKENTGPIVTLKDGVYRMRWKVRLRGQSAATTIVRNFKIMKNRRNDWVVKEFPPIDEESASISPLGRLPVELKFNLPEYGGRKGSKR